MLLIPGIVPVLTLLAAIVVRADSSLWALVDDAEFSFSQLRDGGPRETKPIVVALFESFGVPLGPGQYGLVIQPTQEDDILAPMTATLKSALSKDTAEMPLVKAILADKNSRKQVVATTENDYTHALHGMFMMVVNKLMQESSAFNLLAPSYLRDIIKGGRKTVWPTLRAQSSVRFPNGWFFPDWLVTFPRPYPTPAGTLAHDPKEVLSTVEFKMGGRHFDLITDLQDAFFACGGIAVGKPSSTSDVSYAVGVPVSAASKSGYTFAAADVKAALVRELAKKNRKLSSYNSNLDTDYTTMLDRVLEAAAIATWADTKLTLFAAGSRYFAAGPAAGYGLYRQAKVPSGRKGPTATGVSATDAAGAAVTPADLTARDMIHAVEGLREDLAVSSPDSTSPGESWSRADVDHTLVARQAPKDLVPPSTADIQAVRAAAATNPASNVVFTRSYGSTLSTITPPSDRAGADPDDSADSINRKATFLTHVLALTMDKLINSGRRKRPPPKPTGLRN